MLTNISSEENFEDGISSLFVVQRNFCPARGGASRRIEEHVLELERRFRWNVTVLSNPTTGFKRTGAHEDVNVEFLIGESQSLWSRWAFSRAVIKRLKFARPMPIALHFNAPMIEGSGIVSACRDLGVRSVLQLTLEGQDDPQSLTEGRRYPSFMVRRWIDQLAQADAILTLSPAMRQLCLKFGWPESRVHFLPQAKDPDFYRPVADEKERSEIRYFFGLPDDALIIGFVGNLVRRKGLRELVGAWSEIRAKHRHAYLAIVGVIVPGEESFAHAQLGQLGENRVHYLGYLNRKEVAAFLRCLDVFVLPSYREGMPGALVEAMLSGVASVASHLRGVTDAIITDGVDGRLVLQHDQRALAAVLLELLENQEMRVRLGRSARTIAKRFDFDALYTLYDRVYRGEFIARECWLW